MVFKKLTINDVGSYQAQDTKMLKANLKKSYQKTTGPMQDVFEKYDECKKSGKKFKVFKRDKYCMLRDFVTCLAVCHNVTPTYE